MAVRDPSSGRIYTGGEKIPAGGCNPFDEEWCHRVAGVRPADPPTAFLDARGWDDHYVATPRGPLPVHQ